MNGFRMSLDDFSFTLFHGEVPSPPVTRRSLDGLRWLVIVMNHDDRDYGFVVSVFAYALKKEMLSEKQMRRVDRIYDRIGRAFNCDALECQQAVTCYSRRVCAEGGTP